MTLRRKMGLQIAAMIVGILVVGGAALWGLDALHEDYGLALEGYQDLRQVYEVGSHLATARTLLLPEHADRDRAAAEVETAAEKFQIFARASGADRPPARLHRDADAEAAVMAAVTQASAQLRSSPSAAAGDDAMAVNAAIGKISTLASDIRTSIEAHQNSASHKHDVTVRAVSVISLVVVFAALALGIAQYRGVMSPLTRLGAGVRKIAAGHFAERLALRGGGEFVEVADEFNRMAAELDGFYRQLEEKVAQKSKELIRSERLASVGFLAAGVAHEINNPLGIISGYAEYSLEKLKQNDGAIEGDVRKSLSIICEEAFRCKEITGKLLSLARQGSENRQPVCLARVAEQVVSIVSGLSEYRGRQLVVDAPKAEAEQGALTVSAVEAEMKQVLFNLTLNALQATPQIGGEIRIEVRREGSQVQLAVADNGRGMSPASLERIFEPFFTEKRGVAEPDQPPRPPGTGLGLSISHAIIASHGGTITASSDGPGKGSRFVLSLPATERLFE